MKKQWLVAAGLAMMLAVVGLVGCRPGETVLGEIKGLNLSSQQEGIWVTGSGEVSVAPDIATLRLGIEAQEASVAEAQSKATEAMNRVMDVLAENGVADKDIQTQQLSISKVTRWDDTKQREIVIGYRVTVMVMAKIRNIDKTGSIVDAVAVAGGDLTRIDSIAFSVDDPSAYHEEVREKAMADATAKAKQLAKLAGITLGKPTYISESMQVPSPIYQRAVMEKAAAAPMPISPGEMDISLTVQVTYAIEK
ncbi:SIMPL domain-containing protein [Chloroflexota bacterium]